MLSFGLLILVLDDSCRITLLNRCRVSSCGILIPMRDSRRCLPDPLLLDPVMHVILSPTGVLSGGHFPPLLVIRVRGQVDNS